MRVLILSCLLGYMLCPAAVEAFGVSLSEGNVVRWPESTVSYELNLNGSDDIQDGSDLEAVRLGAASWNEITCTAISLQESGTTLNTDTMATLAATDGINRITWVEDNRWGYGKWVLGITPLVYSLDGEIVEADIAFNGYLQSWSTSEGQGIDPQSVAAHELGHFIGAQHVLNGENSSPPPSMSPSVLDNNAARSLSLDDQSFACFAYPASGAYPCDDDCDCPAVVDQYTNGIEYNSGRFKCVSDTCTNSSNAGPSRSIGESCTGADCVSPLFCQPTPNGSYCSKECVTSSDCPGVLVCWPYQDGSGGACLTEDLEQSAGAGEGCLATGLQLTPGDARNNTPTPPVSTGSIGQKGLPDGETAGEVREDGSCACDTHWACDPGLDGSGECSCDPECQSDGCLQLGHSLIRTNHSLFLLWLLTTIGMFKTTRSRLGT
jgi:hypothetical protein